MRNADWEKIKECWSKLLEDLDPKDLVSKLYEHGVLSDDDKDAIECKETRRNKAEKLLQLLQKKEVRDGDVYTLFLDCLRETQPHLADKLKPPGKPRRRAVAGTGTDSSEDQNELYIKSLGVDDLCIFLESLLEKIEIVDHGKVLDTFKTEKITGKVFLSIGDSQLKELCPDLKFGERIGIILERDEYIRINTTKHFSESPQTTTGYFQEREYPRKFEKKVEIGETYTRGKILDKLASRSNKLTDPVHLCIHIDDEVDTESALSTIGCETVRFAAACMNDRRNGTIHFGVFDDTDDKHAHGEVIGMRGLEQRDCDEAIEDSIKNGFASEDHNIATSCIGSTNFIDVIEDNPIRAFVIEVDITPKAAYVKEKVFSVSDQFTKKGKKAPEKEVLTLDAGKPEKLSPDGILRLQKSMKELTTQRVEHERFSTKRKESIPLLKQLQEFFCDGDTKMADVYPILVINGIDTTLNPQEIHSKFAFLANIDWMCIFDFDSRGSNGSMYKYFQERHQKEFKIKLTSDFDQRGSGQPQGKTDENLQEEMTSSHLVPWIFCNGYPPRDEQELDVIDWKTERSEGYKEAVRYFSHEIPRNRAKVVFLLLSKHYNAMLEAAEELCLRFQNQWIVMGETESVTANWQEQMLSKNYVKKEALERRLVVDNKLEDIAECMQDITDETCYVSSECSLVTRLGTIVKLPKNTQNKLCDLDILSVSECSSLEELTELEARETAQIHGTNFYQGQPPTWVNFYHASHVLKRKCHEELLQEVDKVLKGDIPDNSNIGRVAIYHQPGSGGTTMAKQVLWDMREKYRCCELKSYSDESHHQIVELWSYNEDVSNALPLLVLIDNLDEDKLQKLAEQLQAEADKCIEGRSNVMCVLLQCQRQTTLPPKNERCKIILKQELYPGEKNWFQSRYNDIAESFKRQNGPDPKNLLSFNIMKENFNEKYIQNTVDEILRAVKSEEEKILIKYVSLINAYDQNYRGVPVPCFDVLMTKKNCLFGRRWESMLSPSATMVLAKSKSKITVVNPLLCHWLLKHLLQSGSQIQTLGEAVIEFLHSELCRQGHNDRATRELFDILRDMMKRREPAASGKPKQFSRLIQELYDDKKVDEAAEILQVMFEMTQDAYIAQQTARLFIVCENWEQATHFANEGIRLRKDSSYLWDTHGQIFKFKLLKIFETGMTDDMNANKKRIQEAVEYAYEGTVRFRKVQQLACNEASSEPNTAGYLGEIGICISLLEVFCLIPRFKRKSEFQRFLAGAMQTPEELALLTEKQMCWLQGLEINLITTLRKLEDDTDRYVPKHLIASSSKSQYFNKKSIEKYKQDLASIFGDDDLPTEEEAKKLSPDRRRRLVRNLCVTSLQSLLKLSKEDGAEDKLRSVYILAKMNAMGNQPQGYDYRVAVGSSLVLSQLVTSYDHLDYEDLLTMSRTLHRLGPQGDYIDFEPFLYLLLLHWPTQSRKQFSSLEEPDVLLEVLNRWKEAYSKKYPTGRQNPRVCGDRPFFFLTTETGIAGIVHIDQLKGQHQRSYQLRKVLGTERNRCLLQRFEGILLNRGLDVSFQLETSIGNKLSLKIPLYIREPRESLNNKQIHFALGFGWSGLMACDIMTDGELAMQRGTGVHPPQAAPSPRQPFLRPRQPFLSSEARLRHPFLARAPPPRQPFLPRTLRPRQPFLPDVPTNIHRQVIEINQRLRDIQHLKSLPTNNLSTEEIGLIRDERRLVATRQMLLNQRLSFHQELMH